MSDNIPFEIQMEIIQRIPDSKKFVIGHTRRHIQQQPRHLLIRGLDTRHPYGVKSLSVVDDDTFPHQKFNLSADSVRILSQYAKLVGSSHGLFCLYDRKRSKAVILNPSISKAVLITIEPYKSCSTHVLFGVCHNTLDPKIVKIVITEVEVFTLSSGPWRGTLNNTSPLKSIVLGNSQAVVDGFIYCDARGHMLIEGRMYSSLILSFDLTSEEFTELDIPNGGDLYVSNLRESLGVIQYNCDTHRDNFNIWIMKGRGCTRSFEKLYHISPSDAFINMTLGFRTNGAPIVEMKNNRRDSHVAIAAYEPKSKDITQIWSDGIPDTFCVHSYMETLLLLGQ